MTFITDGRVGYNLTETVAGTGTSFDQGNEVAVGTRVQTSNGGVFQYVHAAAAITQYSCVTIDEDGEASMSTKTAVDAGHQIGFAQVAFADNDFGWVCIHSPGNITVRALADCAADVQLYTSGTPGALDDTSGSQTLIRGVVLAVAATNTASSREAIAVYPNGTATP